jgi:hypothetical protein
MEKKRKRLKPKDFNVPALQSNAKKFVKKHPILSKQFEVCFVCGYSPCACNNGEGWADTYEGPQK